MNEAERGLKRGRRVPFIFFLRMLGGRAARSSGGRLGQSNLFYNFGLVGRRGGMHGFYSEV